MYFSTRNVGKLISRSTFGLARYQFSTAARSKIQSIRKLLQHNIPMYQVPNYTETVSMKLSEVLADLGIDERMILKRRRSWLLRESIENINGQHFNETTFTHIFGSQSEGTTTIDMESDLDHVTYNKELPVIQDWSDLISGVSICLMIQDKSVSPGYCLLQYLGSDAPFFLIFENKQVFYKDRPERLLFKNSAIHLLNSRGLLIHGPAHVEQGLRDIGYADKDHVIALHCTSWPQQARQWLNKQGEGQWPSAEMKQYCSRTGCFLVGVGCHGSEREQLEWRISTSFSERCLMFNLNITQIRCYILMKIIFKTWFKDVITSFMCKNVLFHCVANTPLYTWRENNLLNCLSLCLYLLYFNIIQENCPHFFIPKNNLMRGKIPRAVKQKILGKLSKIINNIGVALFRIKCDDLCNRLFLKCYNGCSIKENVFISGQLLFNLALGITGTLTDTYRHLKDCSPHEAVEKFKNYLSKTVNCQFEGLEKTAIIVLLPIYCTTLGSVLASLNIYQYNTVSADALKLISLGLNTDVASSKLKLASILYCVQEIQKTDLVLSEIEVTYDLQIVEPVCDCYLVERDSVGHEFSELCDNHDEEVLKYITASCVKFLPCEIHCVPTELRYEMFRSTQVDRMFRTERDRFWMDCAVVDSLPYLYFLQYKVNSHLGRHDQKQAALFKLIRVIEGEPNLGHRETALNILGKCMEHEGRARGALQCYSVSLNIRGRNNAAKIHICILLSALINART